MNVRTGGDGCVGTAVRFAFALRALFDLLVPRRCSVCGTVMDTPLRRPDKTSLGTWCCPDCLEDLPLTYFWSWRENPSEQRLWQRVGIVRCASLYFYRQGSGYARLVQAVKYEGQVSLGLALGRALGERLRVSFSDVQALVPVPLHPLRRLKRGYNQAEVIARGIAQGLSGGEEARLRPLPVVTGLLRRSRRTRTQTRLSAEEKARNVRGAFRIRPRRVRRLQAQGISHLLVVDDVMTSGATLSEAIRPLLRSFRISVATIAFVE